MTKQYEPFIKDGGKCGWQNSKLGFRKSREIFGNFVTDGDYEWIAYVINVECISEIIKLVAQQAWTYTVYKTTHIEQSCWES